MGEFRLCGTEVGLGLEGFGLFVDVVLIDGDDVLTLVEGKLIRNHEVKRKVLGQTLEYVTAAYMKGERMLQALKMSCGDELGIDWSTVRKQLRNRRIRGVIAADKLLQLTKRTIELLNEGLKNVELLGLELRRYCDEGFEVLVPQIVGVTTETVSEGKGAEPKVRTYDDLRVYMGRLNDDTLKERLLEIISWLEQAGLGVPYGKLEDPSIKVQSKLLTKGYLLSISCRDGGIYVYLGTNRLSNFKEEKYAYELFNDLKQAQLLPSNVTMLEDMKDGKVLTRKLGDMSQEEYRWFLEILRKYAMGAEDM